MKFSIVTNAYNQARFLRRALDSVLDQEGVDLEYFVVDPGSTDGTAEILSQYSDSRLHIVRNADNGPADGLNRAFARATGDVFAYLNADDSYLRGTLQFAREALRSHPNAGAIYGDGYIADVKGRLTRKVRSTPFSPLRYTFGAALVLQQSTFYRASAFRAVGGFNVDNRTSWDLEILLAMARRRVPLVHVPGFWSVFTIHSESITGSQRLAQLSRVNHERMFREIRGREMTAADRLLQRAGGLYSKLVNPPALFDRITRQSLPVFPELHLIE